MIPQHPYNPYNNLNTHMYCSPYSLTAYDQTRNLYSCIQTLYINAIVIPHPFVITIMAQRVGLTKNISEFGKTIYTLYLFHNNHAYTHFTIFMFIHSVIQIGFYILSFLYMFQPQSLLTSP